LLSMGVKDIINFDFIDKPNKKSLIQSIELLCQLGFLLINFRYNFELIKGAIDMKEKKLSELGKKLSIFPIPPMYINF
jgi:HrpA-like RNA helicase